MLSRLLQRKDVSTITVFARNGEKLEILRTLGDSRIETVKGDLRDHSKLQTLASEHDIVFNVADADAVRKRSPCRSTLQGGTDADLSPPWVTHLCSYPARNHSILVEGNAGAQGKDTHRPVAHSYQRVWSVWRCTSLSSGNPVVNVLGSSMLTHLFPHVSDRQRDVRHRANIYR